MDNYKFVIRLNTNVTSNETHEECYENMYQIFGDGNIDIDAWFPQDKYI